jgi:predicted metal-dependent peptidase
MMTTTKIEKTDPRKDELARERLIVSRVAILMQQPFFGNIATRLTLQNADDWCPTAATDGRHLFYNSEFICKLKEKEVTFLVGHELLHVIYDHIGRRGTRDPDLSNIAADYAVNDSCVEYRLGEKITSVPLLYDPKYHGWAYEQIYDDLLSNCKKIDMDKLMKMVLDDHMEDSEDGSDPGTGSGSRPVLTAEERQQIKDEIKEAMLSAAQAVGVGNVPAGIKRLIDGLTESKMDWREILNQRVEAQIKNDFTYMKPSRRGWGCDAVLPSMKREPSVEATLALDMSGSIGVPQIKDFFGEIKGIVEQHASFNIGVLTFDTQCYNYQVFTEDNVDEIYNYEPQGGGGTSFDCIYDFLKEQEIEPKQLIIFTDMECHCWGDPDYCDTVWLAHKSNRVAPHGMTVKYE